MPKQTALPPTLQPRLICREAAAAYVGVGILRSFKTAAILRADMPATAATIGQFYPQRCKALLLERKGVIGRVLDG